MNREKIKIFTPPKYIHKKINISILINLTQKQFHYASKGRYALMHILCSYPEVDSILLPAFACNSILKIIIKLGIQYDFYDLDFDDLNANIDSIKFMAQKTGAKAVLIASMYGNPANLWEIHEFCRNKHLILIDDAAQSFGAKLDGQLVGTFGDAGFFSFSPGKPTAGHMGALFWTQNNSYKIHYTHHNIIHKIVYLDYYFNRLHVYRYSIFYFFKILKFMNIAVCKYFDISNDNIANFEKKILGGILYSMKNGDFNFRQHYLTEFTIHFKNNALFQIVKAKRGTPNNHKIVIKCTNIKIAQGIIKYCLKNNIYAGNGYKLLTDKLDYIPVSKSINGCIVEFPIEDNLTKMEYLFNIIDSFVLLNTK